MINRFALCFLCIELDRNEICEVMLLYILLMELPAFTEVPSPLTMPITPGEVQRAISKLNSGRACGHDDLPADLLKSAADLIAPAIAGIFNDALEHHESLDIGK